MGTANQSQRVWRLPAREIERNPGAATIVMLEDPAALLCSITEADVASSQIQFVLEIAKS
jgi:hypothetical protein